MKILFIIHALTGGGAERVMATLLNNLCQRGYNICLLTDTETPFAYDIDERVELINLRQTCPDDIHGFRRKFWGYYKIRKVAKEVQCDLAVSFLTEMNCTATLALLGTGIPLICSEHSNVLRKYPKRVLLKRFLLYHFPSVVTVLTHHDYKLWRKKYRNCVRMPNPSDLLEKTLTNKREKVVLAVGRVKQWEIKGFDNLIRAWAMICHQHQDWQLQIAGDYDEDSINTLKGIIKETDAENVVFLGFRRDIGDLMDRSAVFVLSSRVEGLPMALIEAMNRECCCVAFDVTTGPSEIIVNEKSGLLVPNQDVAALSKALETVMSDEGVRIFLASNSKKSVIRYETNSVVNRWELLLKTVCNIHNRANVRANR